MKTRLKPLYLALCTIFGTALHGTAFADNLSGTFTDITGTTSSSGPTISASSSNQQLGLGLNWLSSGYSGDLSTSTMSATADVGQTARNGVNNLISNSSITYTTTITNTGSSAANYTFDLNLNNSSLVVVPQYAYPSGAGTATSAISASVLLNNSSIWSSSATLSTTSNYSQEWNSTNLPSYSLTTTGNGFLNGNVTVVDPVTGSYNGSNYENVSFGNTSLDIALGVLNPGQTDTLTYTLSASSSLSGMSGGGFQGYGGAVATIGDPFGSSGPEFQVQAGPVTPVPEAETVAMMAPGLLMVAVMAKRKKKAKEQAKANA